MDNTINSEAEAPREVRARVGAGTHETMQKLVEAHGFSSIDELLMSALGGFVDRNKTGYFVEIPALILEFQALRKSIEALTIGNLQLAELFQISEANNLESIAGLLTAISKSERATPTTSKRL